MPKVSVIVPIYKVEKYLVQCIDSILNQTLKDIEVILVDEGDMDACRYIIDHYEQTDTRVKTIHEKNGGYGASVNKGFDIAVGEYISIIESDDFIEPAMYEEMYNYAKKLDADVVKTPYFEYWDKTKTSDEIIRPCFWIDYVKNVPQNKCFSIDEYPVFMGIHPSIWAAIYKTSYIKEKNIRCIEAKGAGYVDNHFRTLTFCQTNKIAWLNKPYNYYRLSNENASWANYNLGDFIKRWNAVHKFYGSMSEDLYKSVAGYALQEEYVNTFERILKMGYGITKEQCEILKENLSYIKLDYIKNSAFLESPVKKELIKLKENPNILHKYIKEQSLSYKNEELILNLFGFIPLFKLSKPKKNTLMLYLFNFIPVIKIKIRTCDTKQLYLFGLIPIAKITGAINV